MWNGSWRKCVTVYIHTPKTTPSLILKAINEGVPLQLKGIHTKA